MIRARWLERLETDLDLRRETLAKKLAALQAIAPLEDAAVAEGQKLAPPAAEPPAGRKGRRSSRKKDAEAAKSNVAERGTRRTATALSGVVTAIKRSSEEWQRCLAAQRALEDLEGPVLERYQNAEGQRTEARRLVKRALELIPEQRSWPPTGQTLGGERGQLDSLEKQWSVLQSTPTRAIQVVSKLGSLSEQYSTLAGRIRQIVERAEQEQKKINELEAHLEESKQIWNELRDANPENGVMRSEINILTQETDQDLEALRQRYLTSNIPYNQILQNVRALCQKLDSAQIEVGDGRLVDINGDVVSSE